MKVLVVNAGSSSLKFQLIDMDTRTVLAKGNCERIGIEGSSFKYTSFKDQVVKSDAPLPDHITAFRNVIDNLTHGEAAVISDISDIDAVGHRIVNGGDKFSKSVLVDDQVLKDFESVINFAPLHNPPAMTVIKACLKLFGSKVPNVLVFDTAFHQTMPPKAYIFGVPYKYYEKYKIRRYGAHGTSHRFVSARCAEIMGKKLEDLKLITCHLGNGSSITAIDSGKCVDTSMGLTPLGGLIMGTRSGDLDPSVVTFIMDKEGISPREMENMLNKESGFMGVSGVSSDSRDLDEATAQGNKRAALTQEILRYQIKKYIGAYTAAMGGLDAVVFTGGIGENSDLLREAVCSDMEFFGITFDAQANKTMRRGKEGEISAKSSKTRVFVIPTDEEYMIAKDTKAIADSLR